MEMRIKLERRGKDPSQIKVLNLDNSRGAKIEGLTDEYSNLEVLSLAGCGLESLKGFPNLPSLRKLELSDNHISNGLDVLSQCPKLVKLNLNGNQINNTKELEAIACLSNIRQLDLSCNGICDNEDYPASVFDLLPQLQYLDGFDAEGNEVDDSEDEEHKLNAINGGSLNSEHASDETEEESIDGEEEDEEDYLDEEEDSEDAEDDEPGLSSLYNSKYSGTGADDDDDDDEDYTLAGEVEDDANDDDIENTDDNSENDESFGPSSAKKVKLNENAEKP